MRRIAPLLLLALALFPAVGGDFYVNLASQLFIAAILASSLNLLVGFGGMVSLGHSVWLGIAAYASAWLYLHLGLDHLYSAPLALLITLALAGVFGWIALRATGLGFLMITLALAQVVWGTAYRWTAVTNGDNGLSGLTRPALFGISLESPAAFYYFALAVGLAALWFLGKFTASPFGAALRGTRFEPRRMAALGYDVWRIRWLTYVYASFWGGVAGLLFVYYHKYVHPSTLSVSASAEALLGVIAGGAGTLAGPVVGAAIVVLLKNYVSAYFERWNMLLGIVFVLIVLFLPEGVVPGIQRWWARRGMK